MFCKNCGNQVADGAAFCGVCGAKIANAPVPENNAEVNAPVNGEAPVERPAVNAEAPAEQPVAGSAPADVPVTPAPTSPAPAPKKSHKKLLFIGLPIVAVVLVVALCFNSISAMFIKLFGSDSSYLAYVEGKAIGGYSETFTGLYGKGYENIGEVGAEGELVLEVGDTLTTMLSSYASGMDLSWLNQVKILVDMDSNTDKGSGVLTLVLGDQTILTLEYVMDNTNGVMYVRCKELNEKYIEISMPDASGMTFMSTSASSSDANAALNILSELVEYLPTEEQLSKLIDKYVEIALKQVTDDIVTKSSGEVTASGITESCTVLEVKVTEKFVLNMVKAILEEAQNDGDIIAILENIQKGAEEITADAADENIVEEYKTAVSDGLAEINELIANVSGNGQELLTLIDYINGSDEIIGREITSNMMTGKFAILSAEKGGDIGYEITAGDAFSFAGTGNKSGDAITGEYSLAVQGQELLTVGLEKFNASNLADGELTGAVIFKLGSGAASMMDSSTYSTLALLNPSIRMDFDIGSGKSSCAVSALTGDNVLVKLSASGNKTSANVADIPAEGDTISSDEIDSSDLNLNAIIENLKKAGVPENLLSVLQYYTAG